MKPWLQLAAELDVPPSRMQDALEGHGFDVIDDDPLMSLQRRSAEWVATKHPGHGDIWRRLAKLTEEVGELNRAVIAQDEGRPGRGDPAQEAAQVVLVLMSIAHLLGIDLIASAEAEYQRATS